MIKTYIVPIRVTQKGFAEVDANSEKDAIKVAKELAGNGKIELVPGKAQRDIRYPITSRGEGEDFI